MDVASAQIGSEKKAADRILSRNALFFFPKMGLRGRQVALLTLFVATIVAVLMIANIANLTSLLINRTREQAGQLAGQITYATQQDLAHINVADLNFPYVALANDDSSGTRRLMESQIATKGAISYLYITDKDGQIAKDKQGQNPLAANSHMIGDLTRPRPDLVALAE